MRLNRIKWDVIKGGKSQYFEPKIKINNAQNYLVSIPKQLAIVYDVSLCAF